MTDGRWIYIDRQGGEIARAPAYVPQDMSTPEFHDGLAPLRTADKVGYIDESGNFVISPVFTEAEPFCEGYARVRSGVRSKWGFIDTSGRPAFKAKFTQAEDFHDGLARVLAETDDA